MRFCVSESVSSAPGSDAAVAVLMSKLAGGPGPANAAGTSERWMSHRTSMFPVHTTSA